MALADSDFSRLRTKIKIVKNFIKGIGGVVVDDVWIWRKWEDRLMTIELEGNGMIPTVGPSWVGWLVGWNGMDGIVSAIGFGGMGLNLGNGLGNGGVLVHGQSVQKIRYIHRA